AIVAQHEALGERWFICDRHPELLFTENETNYARLFGAENSSLFVKDGINDYVVDGVLGSVNPERTGTKASAHYSVTIAPETSYTLRFALLHQIHQNHVTKSPLVRQEFEQLFKDCQYDADEFYREIIPQNLSPDSRNVMRQAFAGLLWSKQFYNYDVRAWLSGDPAQAAPAPQRRQGRNRDWIHFYAQDIISMPDKWEYPWFAAWDL